MHKKSHNSVKFPIKALTSDSLAGPMAATVNDPAATYLANQRTCVLPASRMQQQHMPFCSADNSIPIICPSFVTSKVWLFLPDSNHSTSSVGYLRPSSTWLRICLKALRNAWPTCAAIFPRLMLRSFLTKKKIFAEFLDYKVAGESRYSSLAIM